MGWVHSLFWNTEAQGLAGRGQKGVFGIFNRSFVFHRLQYLMRGITRPENLFAQTATKAITALWLFGLFFEVEAMGTLDLIQMNFL